MDLFLVGNVLLFFKLVFPGMSQIDLIGAGLEVHYPRSILYAAPRPLLLPEIATAGRRWTFGPHVCGGPACCWLRRPRAWSVATACSRLECRRPSHVAGLLLVPMKAAFLVLDLLLLGVDPLHWSVHSSIRLLGWLLDQLL
jgi:hypothetical protein